MKDNSQVQKDQVIQHNRKLAIMLGTGSGLTLIIAVYLSLKFIPEYLYWCVLGILLLELPVIMVIANRFKRK